MFVTHGHTDHVLGVIWVMRKVADLMNKGKYEGTFHIYCHEVVMDMLLTITKMTLKKKDLARIGDGIEIHEVTDGESVELPFAKLTAFDICSTKAKQFGYVLDYPDGLRLTCLGDEPFNEHDRAYAEHADWLLSEAPRPSAQRTSSSTIRRTRPSPRAKPTTRPKRKPTTTAISLSPTTLKPSNSAEAFHKKLTQLFSKPRQFFYASAAPCIFPI